LSDWKRTGKPAHNKGVERSAEDEPEWEADPACQVCGGSGTVWSEQPVMNYEGECVDVEFINEPCDCVFAKWVLKADPHCRQCKGTGAVQERLIHPDTHEEYIKFHDCVCLRLVKEMTT